jgi:glycosyltransferase involved in cell wall biosynthesis
MLGRHAGWVPNPAELLAPRLQTRGYHCLLTSPVVNRYRRLADIVRTIVHQRSRIDVLCLQVYSGASAIVDEVVSRLGRLFGHGIVMVLHGGAMPQFIARYPRPTCAILKRAHVLVAPSAFLARAIRPYGFQARVIPNMIDLADYPYRHRRKIEPRLLWMRTFHDIYNPQMAVQVVDNLRRRGVDVCLTMAGQEKGTLGAVQALIARLGLAERVRFAGFLDHGGKQREFAAHDVFLNTNRVDNMPVSVVEAAAFGLPIVATAVGGVPDLLSDGETGLLVPDDDAPAMTAALECLLADSDLAGRLSANGRRLAERSSWESVFPLWEQAFAAAMQMR